MAIWQPCCTDLATLFIAHFSKWLYWIPRPQKHRFSLKNHVFVSITSKVMYKTLKNYAEYPLNTYNCDVITKSAFCITRMSFLDKTQNRNSFLY